MYLNEKAQFDEEIIKGINFLDHHIGQHPSKRLTNLCCPDLTPENDEGKQMSTIGGSAEAIKVIYQSDSGRDVHLIEDLLGTIPPEQALNIYYQYSAVVGGWKIIIAV